MQGNTMKTALVIGINGNFGSHIAHALRDQGWSIRALLRDPAKAPAGLALEAVLQGDAQDPIAVKRAAQGVDALVYAANPPYPLWAQQAMAMIEPSVQAAETLGLQLVFPGNVYTFAPQAGPIDEAVAPNPPTDKGVIRLRMEERLYQASQRGARVLIVRAGDFIGPNTHMTWVNLMATVSNQGVTLKLPHDAHHVHCYSYLPDLCSNTALLLREPLPQWAVFHDPGLAVSEADWRSAFAQLDVPVTVRRFPWWGLQLAALFSPLLREVQKMRYLWQQPVLLNGHKWQERLSSEMKATPLTEVIRQAVLNTDGRRSPVSAASEV
jgi:nucleoside-diphosphate-sugar epimerase